MTSLFASEPVNEFARVDLGGIEWMIWIGRDRLVVNRASELEGGSQSRRAC